MKLVVDTNILFSLFWKGSITDKLLRSKRFELFAPQIAMDELNKYSDEICKKANISKSKFSSIINSLKECVAIIPRKRYTDKFKEAILISPDRGDSEFLALCIHLSCPLWSNDKLLSSQEIVKVFSTKDIISILF
jgi:predicted nucleic acid-binding protein